MKSNVFHHTLTESVNLKCPEDEKITLLLAQFIAKSAGNLVTFHDQVRGLVLDIKDYLRAVIGRKKILC